MSSILSWDFANVVIGRCFGLVSSGIFGNSHKSKNVLEILLKITSSSFINLKTTGGLHDH